MTNEQIIRSFRGKIIGYIETDSQGNKIVRDFYRRIVGRYRKSTDTTTDFYGRAIARGDASASLLNLNNIN